MSQSRILLRNEVLARSSVVANSAMNRERVCIGGNSYAKELSLNPLAFLQSRLLTQTYVQWLDLCCGSGKALIEAALILAQGGSKSRLNIIGLDLVGMFQVFSSELTCLRLLETSVDLWEPASSVDLITCVHGLHYVGDKLDLIKRAISWLKPDGVFAANLDYRNLKFANGDVAGTRIVRELRKQGVNYNARKHLLVCNGKREIESGYVYIGADDTVGPNYTGQAAVDSYYRIK